MFRVTLPRSMEILLPYQKALVLWFALPVCVKVIADKQKENKKSKYKRGLNYQPTPRGMSDKMENDKEGDHTLASLPTTTKMCLYSIFKIHNNKKIALAHIAIVTIPVKQSTVVKSVSVHFH